MALGRAAVLASCAELFAAAGNDGEGSLRPVLKGRVRLLSKQLAYLGRAVLGFLAFLRTFIELNL